MNNTSRTKIFTPVSGLTKQQAIELYQMEEEYQEWLKEKTTAGEQELIDQHEAGQSARTMNKIAGGFDHE